MTIGKFPVLHQVTVEFMGKRQPLVYDFANAEDAQRSIETLKQTPEAWHIFYSVQKALHGKRFIQVSLYRSPDSKQWSSRHVVAEIPGE